MGARTRYHVTPKDGGWQVKREGAQRATSKHPTQGEALEAARRVATNQGPSQVIVHRPSGQIREERTYSGSDPYPPPG
jgi:hypothetical protein